MKFLLILLWLLACPSTRGVRVLEKGIGSNQLRVSELLYIDNK